MDGSLFDEVATLIAEEAGVRRESLTPDTRLLHDLTIYGDDAELLFRALDKRYRVDWRGLNFDRYFYPEPHMFEWRGLLYSLLGMRRAPKAALTIRDLMRAVEQARWTDPAA